MKKLAMVKSRINGVTSYIVDGTAMSVLISNEAKQPKTDSIRSEAR